MYYCTIPQTIPNSNPIVPLLIVLMRWYRGIENTIIHKRAWSFVHGLLTKHSTMYATTRSIFLISLIENRRGRNCCKQHHLVPLVVSSMPHSGWKNGQLTQSNHLGKSQKYWIYPALGRNSSGRHFTESAIFTSY